jgi:hypothetical protein
MQNLLLPALAAVLLASCTDPAAYADACTSYGFEPGTEAHGMCMMDRANAQAEKNQRTAAALDGMTLSGSSSNSTPARAPGYGGSAVTVGATDLCPLQNGIGTLRDQTVSGMNRICFYR